MASKKKKKAKPARSQRKATRAKPKVAARAKAKAKATRAKPKATRAKPKKKVTRAKPKATARAKVTARKPVAATAPAPQVLDEVIEESLLDVSGILRIQDAAARSQRDVDEDALKQFPDPSLVVEAEQRKNLHAESDGDLPELFAAEARRDKGEPANGEPQRDDEPLFGKLRDSDD